MGYGYGKWTFPKEIIWYVFVIAIVAGAAVIVGPYLLSAINSGGNTNPATNPSPVDVPKTGGDQLPVVNTTTPAPKTEWISDSDNVRIVGNGLKVRVIDNATIDIKKIPSGSIRVAELPAVAYFDVVVDRNSASASVLKGVVLDFRGTTIKNFTLIDNPGSMIVTATISAGENLRMVSSNLDAWDPEPIYHSWTVEIGKEDLKEKENHIIGTINEPSEKMKERLSKAKVLHLLIIIETKT